MKETKSPGEFPDTLQKDVLRERDRRLVQKLATDKGRLLTYCGMCGKEAIDVIKWKCLLDRVEVIERPLADNGQRLRFKTSVLSRLTPHFNGNVRVNFIDAWDYLASADFATDYPIDVVNLDFCGGMCYESDMEYPRQRLSFTNLFSSAARTRSSFLLFMTLMPRDKGKSSYKSYIASIYAYLVDAAPKAVRAQFTAQAEASQKFHESSNLSLFKACIPLLLDDIGRGHNLDVKPAYVRLYTTMIHLAFHCTFIPGVLGLPPRDKNTLVRVLNQPMRKLLSSGVEETQSPPQLMLI